MSAFSSTAFSVSAFSESAFDFGTVAEESASSGGGIFVRDKKRRRPERPARDIAHPTPRHASFTPVIRDTTASTPNGPDLPALLAAWMAFEDH